MAGTSVKSFMHDVVARKDAKLIEIDAIVGKPWGYAMYFQTLELLLENGDIYISKNDVVRLSRILGYPVGRYTQFMSESIRIGLFTEDERGNITSQRLQEWYESSDRIKEARKGAADASTRNRIERDKKENAKEPESGAYEVIREKWNSCAKMYRCVKLTDPIKRSINARISEFGKDGEKLLCDAIDNYHTVVNGDEYFWTYSWPIIDFLKPNNVAKFSGDREAVLKNYRDKNKKKQGTGFEFEKRSIVTPPKADD